MVSNLIIIHLFIYLFWSVTHLLALPPNFVLKYSFLISSGSDTSTTIFGVLV